MKTIVSGAAVLLGAVLVPACSSEDTATTDDTNVVNVKIAPNEFQPATVSVKVGQVVRWTWAGGAHNVVSGPDCATSDGAFRSGSPQSGGTFEKKFEKSGTFKYHCESHCDMGMQGEVIVE